MGKKHEGVSNKKRGKRYRVMKVILLVLGVILLIGAISISVYAYQNMNYDKGPLKKTYNAGYEEKQVTLEDGTVLNYAEGPDNGPPLLLIHGQTMKWEDYARVLPDLAKYYHVFAIDCHGHGKSSQDASKYSAVEIGQDFVWFIENVIGEASVISGHSSGGILAAWIAAHSPENVLGLVLEDPPFFSVEPEEMENTFVWLDGFEVIHSFKNQSAEEDYVVYYFKNSYIWGLFGDMKSFLAKSARNYREKNSGKPLKIWYVPYQWIHGTLYLDEFDLEFSEAFYTGSWFEGFSQEETLSKIEAPTVYIKAETAYGKDGVLYAANSDEDAERVVELIKGSEMITIKSGHDIHFEKPKEFIRIMVDFFKKID